MRLTKNKYYNNFLYKISDDHFYNALKITLSAAISFGLFYEKYGTAVAFGMTLGASLCSPIDTSSSLKNKVTGLVLTAILLPAISIVLTLLYSYSVLFYIVFAVIVFLSSIISVYGQRASQMSFTLLLGVCLSFIHVTESSTALHTGFYMFCGGMLYLCISVIFYLIRPTKYIYLQMSICIDNISQYLNLRSKYWENGSDIDKIKNEQLALQVTINDSLSLIDQFLDFNKSRIVNSESNEKIIIATSILNEIMELTVSTTFDNKEIESQLSNYTELRSSIQEITVCFSENLEALSQSMRLGYPYSPAHSLTDKMEKIQDEVSKITDLKEESKLYIGNILDYLNNQNKKIHSLVCVCTGKPEVSNVTFTYQDVAKFFAPDKYRFKTLIDNLNFKSTYLRYALRVTIAMVAGLFFGDFIALKKEYWVLLTIVVIMRPGYGLTKARMNKRVLGTLIGGFVGIVILYFVTNTVVLMVATAVAMLCGYWYSSNNYKIGVTFTTLYIILMYGLLKTSPEASVMYRVTDTLMGALIAFLATSFLWPSWEVSSMKQNLIDCLNHTVAYVKQFKLNYIQGEEKSFDVQKTRQGAFIAIGNLMASYQRLIQEPKGKQQNRSELYKIAVLNQTLIGAIASLGSFFRSYDQDSSNFVFYGKLIDTVINNLYLSLSHFGETTVLIDNKDICNATDISNTLIDLNKKLNLLDVTDENRKVMEESQLVIKQLSWIVDLSEQIESTAKLMH